MDNDCEDCHKLWAQVGLKHGVRRYLERKPSMRSRWIAEGAAWAILLAGGTTLLQAQKKGGGETKHSAAPAHEPTPAPPKQEHTPPPEHAKPAAEHPITRGEHASPAPEHPAAGSQGRTFSNRPAPGPRGPNSAVRPA